METLQLWIQENWMICALALAALVPFVYFTRRYSLPIFLWAAEYTIYCSVMHIIIHYFVILVVWFKVNTTMYMNERVDPGWGTPLTEFWNSSKYAPEWIFYAEVLAVFLILMAMWYYRPFATQKVKKRYQPHSKGELPEEIRRKYSKNVGPEVQAKKLHHG